MRVPVSAPLAAKPVGPYSPGIRVGQWLFLSGQVGFEPSTGLLVEGGITAQTEQVMRNIATLLDAAGASFANVAKMTVFLADMNDFAAMTAVYARHVVDPPPARSTVEVSALPRQALVEIDVVAILD